MDGTCPDFLTVDEAARVLRIGRTAAYDLTRIWRDTDGAAGLPVVPVGRSLRVPATALEAMLGRPLTSIPEPRPKRQSSRPTLPARPPRRRRPHDPEPPAGGQPTFPL